VAAVTKPKARAAHCNIFRTFPTCIYEPLNDN